MPIRRASDGDAPDFCNICGDLRIPIEKRPNFEKQIAEAVNDYITGTQHFPDARIRIQIERLNAASTAALGHFHHKTHRPKEIARAVNKVGQRLAELGAEAREFLKFYTFLEIDNIPLQHLYLELEPADLKDKDLQLDIYNILIFLDDLTAPSCSPTLNSKGPVNQQKSLNIPQNNYLKETARRILFMRLAYAYAAATNKVAHKNSQEFGVLIDALENAYPKTLGKLGWTTLARPLVSSSNDFIGLADDGWDDKPTQSYWFQ